MKKKVYKKPSIKVRLVECDSQILAASGGSQDIVDTPPTEPSRSKGSSFDFTEDEDPSSSNNIWNE